MRIRPIVIGIVACLVLPLAGANARAVFDPGPNPAGAGADLEHGVAPTAENFWRDDHCDKDHDGDHDDKDHKSDKDDHCHHCDDGDHDDKGDKDHRDHNCEKSPSKPH